MKDLKSLTVPPGGYTYLVEKLDWGYRVVDREGSVVYTESDSNHAENAIQCAIDNLPSGGGKVLLSEGNYNLSNKITIASNSILSGCGYSTVLNVPDLADAIALSSGSCLTDVKISGTAGGSYYRVSAGADSIIQRVWIDGGGGIDQAGDNVQINNCRFTNIHRSGDPYAVAIHNYGHSGLFVTDFYIADCDRGIEIEDGAKNVYVRNGYILNVPNMAMNVHNHGTPCENVVYSHIYLSNCRNIQCTDQGNKNKNIHYEYIVTENPSAYINDFYAEFGSIKHCRLASRTSDVNYLLYVTGSDIVLYDVVIEEASGWGAIYFENADNCVVDSCYIGTGGSYGLYLFTSTSKCKVINNHILNTLRLRGSGHIVKSNSLSNVWLDGATNTVIRDNEGYPTDSFKATSQSVEIGTSGAYGNATTVTSLSGIIYALKVCKIVIGGSFAAGENVTVKVETNWNSGNTAYVEKTYTATGTHYLDLDGQDGLDLWRDSDTCTSIKLYAKSDQASTSVTVTCDLAGAG